MPLPAQQHASLLWRSVCVETVSELGRLRETFRVSPGLADLVESFHFGWTYMHDPGWLNSYPEQYGTLLDMAFRDRWQMWSEHCEATASQILRRSSPGGWQHKTFTHDGNLFPEPGELPLIAGREPGHASSYDQDAPKLASGPDGNGDDALIKTSDQLIACVVEVVEMLSSLRTFKWDSPIMPMPMGVLSALERLTSLKSLHLEVRLIRNNVHAREWLLDVSSLRMLTTLLLSSVPYWRLVSNLEDLCLSRSHYTYDSGTYRDEVTGEMDESLITSFELPTQLPTGLERNEWNARDLINCSALKRTIVAAARTGRLRHLHVQDLQAPFAVRALLPCWVHIETGSSSEYRSWLGAARSLRPILSHASLWLGATPTSSARPSRRLTGQEVQTLRVQFTQQGVPFHTPATFAIGRKEPYDSPIDLYLPWLQEDADLAQQVADAWNAVVDRGDANVVKCNCHKCKARFST